MDNVTADRSPALSALRMNLLALRDWAEDRLNEDFDRQHIAEHMTEVVDALLHGEQMPPRPF